MSDTLPPLPEPVGFRTRYRSEPGMIGHYPWTYADQGRRRIDRPECEHENLFTADQMLAFRAEGIAAAVAEPVAWSSEHHFALREAHCIGASDAYFKAWPTHDNDAGRMLFERGFVRGFDGHGRLVDRAREAAATAAPPQREPIDMVLHCPACGLQHIDAVEPSSQPDGMFEGDAGWDNPPHRSHLCHGCGHIWRPADVPTNGVATLKTKGKADSAAPPQREPQWQRIETAPRDGTRVLIHMPEASRQKVLEAYWATPWEAAPDEQCWWSTPHGPAGRGYTILQKAVTHWMPLPDAPASAPKEQA